MSLKAKLEAVIYATEEPVTLNELAALLKDAVLADLAAEEQARLALNETVSDGPPPPETETETDDQPFAEDFAGVATPTAGEEPAIAAGGESQPAPEPPKDKKAEEKEQLKSVKARLQRLIEELTADFAASDHGIEIREIAGGYRMATKPEHHDVVVGFAKSLKPPVRLSLQALETLSVIAYKQPVTVPEISEIRGVDSVGVIATLLDRKLITTAGRKQVIGRPILYKTTKEFLVRFGLKDIGELPSMEEFEKLGEPQAELFTQPAETSASAAEDGAVTEAVPDPGHHLAGESTIPSEGTYATEAAPGETPEKS